MSLVGQTLLSRYKVVRPLARGALATVYLAFDLFGTPYAVKAFPKGLKRRAEREFRVGRALGHPRINPVLALLEEQEDRGAALLLAYAPGERFLDWRQGSEKEAVLSVFRQLLEALAHMHARGFVHRDVKPENLVVAPTQEARLLDFDLSGPIGEPFRMRIRLGTLAYLAPEQALGQSPGPEADLYSAGVLLYWALSGELPFTGSPEDVVRAHLQTPPPPIPGLEAELWGYLCRLLAKDPKERFPSAKEALAAFPYA
ncbi:MAG: serine protease [Thermus sp.]|uniref:serine/threonine-protein kinase n=1 Tax=Thermus sp. TaxID=275 RepID=UPI003330975C